MIGRLLLAAVAALVGTAAHAQLADGSFEAQGAAVTSFCYFPSCPSGAWTGVFSGLQLNNNPAWPGSIATPNGTHYAFVQGTGTLSQTFVADASGLFDVNWIAAGRPAGVAPSGPYGGNEPYTVTVNGDALGTFSTTSGQLWTGMSSNPFMFSAGTTYTLAFNGLPSAGNGDNTVYIDAVGLVASVPEPSSWAMMILGFGAAGLAVRWRRKQKPNSSPLFA